MTITISTMRNFSIIYKNIYVYHDQCNFYNLYVIYDNSHSSSMIVLFRNKTLSITFKWKSFEISFEME